MATRTSWLVLNTSTETSSQMQEKTYELFCEMFPTQEISKWEKGSRHLYFQLYIQVRECKKLA